ncbi:MAG: hypothetical protein L0Y62_06085, partial [Nitrospirae bacterium]|nr:hypothetical protein [Nitrospirota bacterium]
MDQARLIEFVKRSLEAHDAVVCQSADNLLETLIPHGIAELMGVEEEQGFGFGALYQQAQGVEYISYNSEALERFSVLIESHGLFSLLGSADLYIKQKGFEKAMSKRLRFLNATYRIKEKMDRLASYLMFNFRYIALSEEKQEGIISVIINEHTLSPMPASKETEIAIEGQLKPVPFSKDVKGLLEDAHPLKKVFQQACEVTKTRLRIAISDFEKSLNVRMNRDIERLNEYYGKIIQEIEKKIEKKRLSGEEREKELSRIEATRGELERKRLDQYKRYGIKIDVALCSALRFFHPVIMMDCEVLRKKGKRDIPLVWNPLIKAMEMPVCERCQKEPEGFFMCDEHLHLLCPECFGDCPS